MTIPKITPYSGGVANPDGSQTQTEFTQNMFDQLSYEAELSTELNSTVDGINDTSTQVDADATSAAQSAAAAEAAVSGLNYQGLWPDTGGSASKGDTYQTQVSGTPAGQYFTALQNTTVDPVGDDVNWRVIIGSDLGGVIGGTKLQHRRGTNAEIMAGVPEIGELWFNTTDDSIHMGDGATQGGVKISAVYASVSDMVSSNIKSGRMVGTRSYRNASPSDVKGSSVYFITTQANYGGIPDNIGDHQMNNGNVAVLINRDGDIFRYGADGVNDTPAIHAALSHLGYATCVGNVVCEDPISPNAPKQTVNIKGDLINSAPNQAGKGFLLLGSFGRTAMHNATYYNLNNFSSGALGVTLSTPSDASNFSEGDIVFIKGGDFYTTGGEDVYEFGQLCKVASSNESSGAITLVDSTDNESTVTGGLVCKVESPADEFSITANNFIATNASRAKLLVEGGGAYKCKINIKKDFTGDSFAFTNANFMCEYNAGSIFCDRHFYELAVNSRRNVVNVKYAELTTEGVSGKRPVRTSEQSANNVLNIDNVNLNRYSVNDIPFYIESRFNEFNIGKVEAKSAPNRIGQFSSQAFTPVAPETRGNIVNIGDIVAGAGTAYWGTNGAEIYDNHLIGKEGKSVFSGATSTGRALDIAGDGTVIKNIKSENQLYLQASLTNETVNNCEFVAGVNDVERVTDSNRYKDNKFGLADQATDNNRFRGTISITQTTPDSDLFDDTFPANSLVEGDYIDFFIGGDISGAAGVKEMRIEFGGITVATVSYSAAQVGDFFISGRVQLNSKTVEVHSFNISSGGTNGVQSGGATISDVSANSTSLKFKAWKGDASDSFLIRNYQVNVKKLGQ